MSLGSSSHEVVVIDDDVNDIGNGLVNGTVKDVKAGKSFSWTQPHPIFVIVLVGADEQPFGIQKDFLCDRSEFYRKYFEQNDLEEALEHIVKLPEATVESFGLAQSFLYTGKISDENTSVTSYAALIGLWNLGLKLAVEGLCEQTLEAMVECRRITGLIPAVPLLIQVWRDTPEGSSIRALLLSWVVEYMRSSDARAEFAKSLPKEVLSELVVAMSSFEETGLAAPAAAAATAAAVSAAVSAIIPRSIKMSTTRVPETPRKNIHYLDEQPDEEALGERKSRRSAGASSNPGSARKKLPLKRRASAALSDSRAFSTEQKLEFCADLLSRMLSGPGNAKGFWTRLVGPFREPVNPTLDGVPDYLSKIKNPMDLSTIKRKLDQQQYETEEDFLADMRQIFDNCFMYWKKGDPMWLAGERLQRTFEEKYSNMHKWIAKLRGEEGE
ncbi:Bromodomain containing protein [Trichoderma cornu-damae]|uniref:Bromodomain containing protein n=1 Tax=Trichoderma cornu-damae TaxID=654480 RepID=A0A9P8QS56_9HYPO|nr:Bromodomain containing protein [Trichoderma cornu-damae]